MQKITPFIWFEKNIKEVTDYYLAIFPGATTSFVGTLDDTPSGQAQMADLKIYDLDISIMTAGPMYKTKPTVSFVINCASEEEAESLFSAISKEGKILMPLASYPFAPKFGWVEDRYGISWQTLYMPDMPSARKVVPTLMFAGAVCGQAEEAMNFYVSTFKNSKVEYISHYEDSEPNIPEAKTKHAGFLLDGQPFSVLDSGRESSLDFEQAISFMVNCEDQAEIDYFWEKFTADGGQEIQCGWLKDKFGMPWQIVPKQMGEMMSKGTPEQIARVTQAFMKMKKFDLETLQKAYEGE